MNIDKYEGYLSPYNSKWVFDPTPVITSKVDISVLSNTWDSPNDIIQNANGMLIALLGGILNPDIVPNRSLSNAKTIESEFKKLVDNIFVKYKHNRTIVFVPSSDNSSDILLYRMLIDGTNSVIQDCLKNMEAVGIKFLTFKCNEGFEFKFNDKTTYYINCLHYVDLPYIKDSAITDLLKKQQWLNHTYGKKQIILSTEYPCSLRRSNYTNHVESPISSHQLRDVNNYRIWTASHILIMITFMYSLSQLSFVGNTPSKKKKTHFYFSKMMSIMYLRIHARFVIPSVMPILENIFYVKQSRIIDRPNLTIVNVISNNKQISVINPKTRSMRYLKSRIVNYKLH